MALDDGYDGSDTTNDGGETTDTGDTNDTADTADTADTSSIITGSGGKGSIDSGDDTHRGAGAKTGGLEGTEGGGGGGSSGGGMENGGAGGGKGGLDGFGVPSHSAWDALGAKSVDSDSTASALRVSDTGKEGKEGVENSFLGLHNKNGSLDKNAALDAGKMEYKEAVRDIKGNYKLSPEKVQELESKEALSKVNTLSAKEYEKAHPSRGNRSLGCHDPKTGALTFKDTGDKDSLKHVATHEVMHKASFGETKDNGDGTKTIASGLRRTQVDEKGGVLGSTNLYLNEGLTESYTLNSLDRRGEKDAADAVTAYYEARVTADRLKDVVGDSKMEAAYFNGELSELESEVNRLGQKDSTWSQLSASLDALYNAQTLQEQNQARMEINSILYRMEDFKNAKQ